MLSVISKAGFGKELNPAEPEQYDSSKYSMSFSKAMETVSSNLLLWAAIPWAFNLPFGRLRQIKSGFADFESYVKDLIANKREKQQRTRDQLSEKDQETDLLSLLCSTQDPDSKITLTNDEIFSDAFIFLLAGTSHPPLEHAKRVR